MPHTNLAMRNRREGRAACRASPAAWVLAAVMAALAASPTAESSASLAAGFRQGRRIAAQLDPVLAALARMGSVFIRRRPTIWLRSAERTINPSVSLHW